MFVSSYENNSFPLACYSIVTMRLAHLVSVRLNSTDGWHMYMRAPQTISARFLKLIFLSASFIL